MGSDYGNRTGGRLGGRIGGWIEGVGQEGSDWGGQTGGVRLGGSDWGVRGGQTGAFHVQKRIKHFFFRNYTKILLNLVNFSPPLQSPQGDVNTKMAFSTKRRIQTGGWTGGNGVELVGNGVGLGGTGLDWLGTGSD